MPFPKSDKVAASIGCIHLRHNCEKQTDGSLVRFTTMEYELHNADGDSLGFVKVDLAAHLTSQQIAALANLDTEIRTKLTAEVL